MSRVEALDAHGRVGEKQPMLWYKKKKKLATEREKLALAISIANKKWVCKIIRSSSITA
jgi:hypothetical protein